MRRSTAAAAAAAAAGAAAPLTRRSATAPAASAAAAAVAASTARTSAASSSAAAAAIAATSRAWQASAAAAAAASASASAAASAASAAASAAPRRGLIGGAASYPDPAQQLGEDEVLLQEMAARFATDELEPHAARWDAAQEFPLAALRSAAAMGFGALYASEATGGAAAGRLAAAVVFETLSMADVSTTAFLSIHNMCAWVVDAFGSDAVRQRVVPELAAMDKVASYCLTEPGSGSDAAALRTRAVKSDDGSTFTLNGGKAFISGGGDSDYYVVMARTGDDSPKGISCFLVEKGTPGLSFGDKEQKLGWNSQPTRAVYFDNCEVPAGNMLGKEGEGFKIAMTALDGGRVNIAACSVGGAQRCLDIAREYVKERKAFGMPLAEFQTIQFRLAQMAAKVYAARLMVRDAARAIDENRPQKTDICAMAKLQACEEMFDVVNECLQLHGGYGYLKDYPIERFLRDVRVHTILEGSSDVMKIIIGRSILKA